MGEYATRISDGERVKIGTCESMYYLRADQRHLVTGGDLGSTPERDYWPHVRFRFPWPDEDSQQPGEFTDGRFERTCALHGVEMPDGVDHSRVQFTAAGYNVCLPCPESGAELHAMPHGDVTGGEITIHRNGFPGAVLLCEQRLKDGKLMAVLQCGGCGAKWRVETWAEIEPAVVALRSEADRRERAAEVSPHGAGSDGMVKWLHTVADRVTAGYGTEALAGVHGLRKRTVFEPCEHHAAMYASESRNRRAEVMAEGGWGSSPCPRERCRMKPGTDFFTVDFVAANPVYEVEQ